MVKYIVPLFLSALLFFPGVSRADTYATYFEDRPLVEKFKNVTVIRSYDYKQQMPVITVEVRQINSNDNTVLVFTTAKGMYLMALEMDRKVFKKEDYKTIIKYSNGKTQTCTSIRRDEDTLIFVCDQSEARKVMATSLFAVEMDIKVKGTKIQKKFFTGIAIRYLLEIANVGE
ncbi:MAG: hypothetical protein Q4F72_09665, partial [Desulfovibrionaceae bacterium]|nr:hypothetical protein [Desulfovibrionaceae bacterium]